MPLSWNEIRHRAIRFAHDWAGTCTEVVQRLMNWDEPTCGERVLEALCGMLVILGEV